MSLSSSVQKWLRSPSRIALLLGFGALSATGAQANTTEIELGNSANRVPQQSAKSFGELAIWSDGGRIYVSEGGKEAKEISLGNTPEARHLRELLERDSAARNSPRKLQDRMILVGGGGSGISWTSPQRNGTFEGPRDPTTTGFGAAAPSARAQTTPSQNPRVQGKTTTTDNSERR